MRQNPIVESFAEYLITGMNGLQGDPAFVVKNKESGESILFDCGDLNAFKNRSLLKSQTVLISHFHFDHVMGLDRWMRVHIPHRRRSCVIGPQGTASKISSRYGGYLWNLLESGQIQLDVIEVHKVSASRQVVERFSLSNDSEFQPQSLSTVEQNIAEPVSRTAMGVGLYACVLDHGTPVLGYAISGSEKWSFMLDNSLDLAPGRWIGDVQSMIALGQFEQTVDIQGRSLSVDELMRICFLCKPPRKLGYLTDFGFTQGNLEAISQLGIGSGDALICEMSFAKAHRDRSVQFSHLTTYQVALISEYLRVTKTIPFHISNIYNDGGLGSLEEFYLERSLLQTMGRAELLEKMQAEFL